MYKKLTFFLVLIFSMTIGIAMAAEVDLIWDPNTEPDLAFAESTPLIHPLGDYTQPQ